MPCTGNSALPIVGAAANAYAFDNDASFLTDGVNAFGNHWAANTDRATNLAPHPDTGETGFDSRSAGDDVWVQPSLASVECVQSVQIAWNYPSERQYRFTVHYSADGINFTQVGGERLSTGISAQGTFETVDVGGVQAQHVRIYCLGNTSNDWNVINELRLLGGDNPNTGNQTFNIQITGNGVNQNQNVTGGAGNNSVNITPSPSLPPGTYNYAISGSGYDSCSGTFVIEESNLERRCMTHTQAVQQGTSVNLNLADFNDGQGGTPTRFVIVDQPALGSFSVSTDGQTLTMTMPDNVHGKVDVEYDTSV